MQCIAYIDAMHKLVWLYVQYNVKLCCLFSSWFAKEANVANNKQRLANDLTRSQRRTGTLSAMRQEMTSQVQLGRLGPLRILFFA